MDRISFLHSINPGSLSLVNVVLNYLDQTMLLYNLVGENDSVSVIDNSTNYISYQIKNKDQSYINNLASTVNNRQDILYRDPLTTKVNSVDEEGISISVYK